MIYRGYTVDLEKKVSQKDLPVINVDEVGIEMTTNRKLEEN